MKSGIYLLVRRCLTLDASAIAKLTDREFLIARQELGVWGIPVEDIDEARRQSGPAPVPSVITEALALAEDPTKVDVQLPKLRWNDAQG